MLAIEMQFLMSTMSCVMGTSPLSNRDRATLHLPLAIHFIILSDFYRYRRALIVPMG